MSELLHTSIMMTIVGIFITFAVLFLLVILLNLLKWVDSKWEIREQKQEQAAFAKDQNIDDLSLVLISASIAAYFKGRAVIKRVRVLPSSAKRGGSWATQTRTVLQSSHITKK